MDKQEVRRLYNAKAKESFKARFNLLLFKHILEGNNDLITAGELDGFKIEEKKSL